MELVRRHFPELSEPQLAQLAQLTEIFREWNAKINLVSRKDIEHFELHHLVHSMALAKIHPLPPRTRVLDVGSGGGLPGLPLAILFPQSSFFLCDSVAKKCRAVSDMAERLKLKNVTVVNKRAELLESRWEYIVGRAVTSLPRFLSWIQKNVRTGGAEEFPCGVLYWKGSLYREELESVGLVPFRVHPIDALIDDPYFAEKYIVHLKGADVRDANLPPVEG